MMKKILVGLLLLLCACNTKDVRKEMVVVTDFPKKAELSVSVIKTEPIILYPEQMFITGNQLFVFQSKKDTLFDVFRLPDCMYMYSVGTKGQGPNEFLRPNSGTIQPVNDNEFTVLDYHAVKRVAVKENGTLETVESFTPFKVFPINGYAMINDSLFCSYAFCAMGKTGDFDFEYNMVNRYTKIEKMFSPYPKLTAKNYEGDEKCQIYHKSRIVHPKGHLFASFYFYFKHFRIYNYKGEIIKEISVKTEPYNSDNLEDFEKRKFYFIKPFATDHYIYVMCKHSNAGSHQQELQVWDWDGNPVIQYFLNGDFSTYAISEKYRKLYATNTTNEDEIYTYDLVHLKDKK
jgi:hypothetical protein